MTRTFEGGFDGHGLRVALVVARFNDRVTSRLLVGAEDCLDRHGCTADNRTVVPVPGSWELPQAVRRLAASGQFDAIVALGALIRGETAHFDLVATEAARGLAQVAMDSGVPVTFGVVTAETMEQALERAGGKMGNRGWDAALASLELANLFRRIGVGAPR